MVSITLPDGSVKKFPGPVAGNDLAADIGPGLAKAALAIIVDDEMRDLSTLITTDCHVSIITNKDNGALELMRHDAAHVMAEAVQELFPGTQVTIGPVIENGFFYDFAREKPFTIEDLATIEKRMCEIVDRDEKIIREVWGREQAIEHFNQQGETYKSEIIEGLPEDEKVTVYKQGDWLDLCRGPHLPSTGKLGKSFKLMKLAGAYWRGDHRNEMLQRIYGTCWANEKQLSAYLSMLEEAERRDHRKLGREMDLFHLQEEAQGSVFWHAKGYQIWLALESYIRRRLDGSGYIEVKTPQILDARFWEKSGHWAKFRENMFVVPDEAPSTEENVPMVSSDAKMMAIKPMNCPAHVQIYNNDIRSYKDLPIRMAEFGCCHRNEPHGALHGLMRVRQMTQDDAHIFCREDQVTDETVRFCSLLSSVYDDLGFNEIEIKLATRPEVRAGSDETWDLAESSLEAAVKEASLAYEITPGEGAFYGPKLEFHLKDAIGRMWQCGTIQLDFVLPERLDANYIGSDGAKHRPVMLHRAILGSLERFIGILIENYAGKLPLWLAPTQVVVATIISEAETYASDLALSLKANGIRVEQDFRNETINYKVREHSKAKVPLIAVIGQKEAESGTIALRRLGGKNQEILLLADALAIIGQESQAPDL